MKLLVADLLYRSRWRAALFAPVLGVMLLMAAQLGEPARGYGISMGIALALGPQTALRFVPRSIWYLPLSRREIWRAGWLVTTVATTMTLLAVKLLVLMAAPLMPSLDVAGADPTLTFAMVALSTTYDFAACGVGAALVIFVTRPQPTGLGGHLSMFLRALAELAIQAAVVGAWYAGGWLHGRLPVRWTELHGLSGFVLVAALALTVATYFYSPALPLVPRAPEPAVPDRKAARRAASHGGLSGLPRLLVHEYRLAIAMGAGLSLASLLIVVVMSGLWESGAAIADMIRAELLFIDGGVPPPGGQWVEAVAALTWYGFFVGTLTARFPSMLRHLRVLPMSTGQLNAVLVCWPAGVWAVAGAVLVAARYLFLGDAVSLSALAGLVALNGVSALAGALTLRVGGLQRIFLLSFTLGAVPLLHLLPAPAPFTLALIGAGALALAASLNHITLRRSSTYRLGHPEMAAAAARLGL